MRRVIFIFTAIAVAVVLGCSHPQGAKPPQQVKSISTKTTSSGVLKGLTQEQIDKALEELKKVNQYSIVKNYRLRFLDEFTITVLGHPEWTSHVRVMPDGIIYFGYISHPYYVFDKTFEEVKKMLITGYTTRDGKQIPGLNKYFENPQVKIDDIKLSPTSNTVTVFGHVRNPGKIPFQVGYTILDVIAQAGGLKERPYWKSYQVNMPMIDWDNAYLARDNKILPIDFYALLREHQIKKYNIPVLPGDIIHIPEANMNANKVLVLGQVHKPGVITFSRNISLIEALAFAGWIDEARADTKYVYIVRKERPAQTSIGKDSQTKKVSNTPKITVYIANVRGIITGSEDANGPNFDVPLQADDIVYVDTNAITDFSDFLTKLLPLWQNLSNATNIPYDIKCNRSDMHEFFHTSIL